MATYEQLIAAAQQADAAGETDDARRLLEMAVALRDTPAQPAVPAAPELTPEQTQFENPTGFAGVLRSISEPLGRFNRAFTNGYTLGLADEIEGAADAAMTGQTYGDAVETARARASEGAAQYPVISGLGNLLGGVSQSTNIARGIGFTPAPTIGGQAVQGAQLGAIEGGIFGFNEGSGLPDRVSGAAKSAGIGAAVGAAAPYVVEGGRRAFDYGVAGPAASMRSAPSELRASRAVRQAVDRSRRTPQEIEQAIRQARATGQDFTIADATGYSGQRMLAGAARTPGEGRQEIIDYLAKRQDGQGRRVAGALDEALNSPRNPQNLPAIPGQMPMDNRGKTANAVRDMLKQERSTAANKAYDAARKQAGPVDVRGVLAAIDDRIGPMQGSGIAGDGIDATLGRFRSRLAAEPAGPAFPGASSVELSDFNRVLGVKQDVEDAIGSAIRAGENNRARELGIIKSELDAALEAASPAYRVANDNFARASRVIEQVDAGIAASSPRARVADTLGVYNAQTPQGQAAFRAGYADPIMARIENAAPGVNKARPLLSDGSVDELRTMARKPDDLIDFLNRENEMFRTANAASGGSMTADNLADAAEVSGFNANPIINLLTGRWGTAATQLGETALNSLTGRNTATREKIAQLLLSGDVQGAITPALKRQIGNMQRSSLIEAMIRSAQRNSTP